jgi:hypothetical protein
MSSSRFVVLYSLGRSRPALFDRRMLVAEEVAQQHAKNEGL